MSSIAVDWQKWSHFFQVLKTESDRGSIILASIWIENLLERKLRALFTKGNSRNRQRLFDLNGPFSSFASKILAAYTIGWIDSDVFHDLELLRKIRNKFAHTIDVKHFEDVAVKKLINEFKIPHRHYSDWSELNAASTSDGRGLILYTSSEPPENAAEPLNIQRLRYQLLVSLLTVEVTTSLGLSLGIDSSDIK